MAVATLQLDHLKANWRALDHASGAAETGAAVKANAYGHGLPEAASALFEAGCRTFFVATLDEGRRLRQALGRIPVIYILNGIVREKDWPVAHASDLRPVLNDDAVAQRFMDAGPADLLAALQINTGMNRLGVSETAAEALSNHTGRLGLIMSHLACADAPNHPLNAEQLRRFQWIAEAFPTTPKSLAATGGVLLGPAYHFDLTRPGIGLYGGGPAFEAGLVTPAIEVCAEVLRIDHIRAGDTVGYGATFTASREMVLATIDVGYADGVLRAASNKGYAMFGGRKRPFVGRVSMDLTVIDVTEAPQPAPGDFVSVFGPGDSLQALAEAAGTIDYELLTGIGERLHRVYAK